MSKLTRGTPGTVHAGYLRAIDTAQNMTCTSTENPLDWNQSGQPGQPGTPGVSGYEKVASDPALMAAGAFGSATATCPGSKQVLGGGYGSAALLQTTQSVPFGTTGWQVTAKNVGAGQATLIVYAICADVD